MSQNCELAVQLAQLVEHMLSTAVSRIQLPVSMFWMGTVNKLDGVVFPASGAYKDRIFQRRLTIQALHQCKLCVGHCASIVCTHTEYIPENKNKKMQTWSGFDQSRKKTVPCKI